MKKRHMFTVLLLSLIIIILGLLFYTNKPSSKEFVEVLYSFNHETKTFDGWEYVKANMTTEDFIYNMGAKESLIFLKIYSKFMLTDPKITVLEYTQNSVTYVFNNPYISRDLTYRMDIEYVKGKVDRIVETEIEEGFNAMGNN